MFQNFFRWSNRIHTGGESISKVAKLLASGSPGGKRSAPLLAFLVGVAVLVAADPPPFKIRTKRPDDKIEVLYAKDSVRFDIRSPFGISHATIERTSADWPTKVLIRLYLKGLEQLSISTTGIKLNASVSTSTGVARLWKDKDEATKLTSEDQLWFEVKKHDPPSNDAYFEFQLPRAFVEKNPSSITVDWIDFYRG